ncbi:unnamed protein product [Rhodiola kirilowii]
MMRKKNWSSDPVCSLFFFFMAFWVCSTKPVAAEYRTVNIGVVLDLETLLGRKSLSILSMALDDFYSSHAGYQTRIAFHVRDSKQDVLGAASAALDLIKNSQVEAIIGPPTSMQTHFILSLCNKAQVPIISFSASSPLLSPTRNPYFFRATQNDSAQVAALSSLVNHFSWREAVPVLAQDEYGEGIVPFLTDALQKVDCRVPYRAAITPEATDSEVSDELYRLMSMETRVFIVHMLPDLGIRVFKKAMEIGMMEADFVWIVSDGMANMLNNMNSTVLESMNGVLGIRNHIPKSKQLEEFRIRWKRKFQSENTDVLNAKLDIFGIWAHDAALALAMAVEKVFGNRTQASRFQSNTVTVNATDLDSLHVSNAGPQLREALLSLSFEGFAGNFHFLNGEIQPYAYQIVNVNENGGRGIGYWTALGGISRVLNLNKHGTGSHPELGQVIWPGEKKQVPKGWTVPAIGKKLRIGVPVKDGFLEFVKVTRDPVTNASIKVTGYCIDVFEAVMEAMPYPVQYEYLPFALLNGTSRGSYNELTQQVFLGNFDAVVGDVTIIANRSLYVDFTLPYTESGVSMIVPIKDQDHSTKNAWVFLKPLTWKLWITSFGFFIFIGFVVWVLEHRTNEDFRGPPLYQIGTMFWFSFSTMVYAHREKVVSNLARFVMIVWVFVVLILIQTYTASLTSMLTVQKLQPTITDINELRIRGDKVGYKEGTFMLDFLKEMKFEESKLVPYKSVEELEAVFSHRRVAAVFDEIPYMRLFLGKHCSEYAMVGPIYKTDGFGFVFPKGSPLAPDVSRAILNVTQGDKMVEIESKWFGRQANCSTSSSSIGLDSFWGLFLIAGCASVSALIIYAANFVYQHRQIMSSLTTSWWNKVVVMSRQFDQKDVSSHTFKKFQFHHQERSGTTSSSPHPMPTDGQEASDQFHDTSSSSEQGQTSPEKWVTVVDVADQEETHQVDDAFIILPATPNST